MITAFWRLSVAVLLSTSLTAVSPIWAKDKPRQKECETLLTGQGEAASIQSFIGKNGFAIQQASIFNGKPKRVFLAPEDSWSRGDNAPNLFTLALRLASLEEALHFIKTLVEQMNSESGSTWAVIVKEENVFEVPGVFEAIVSPPYYARQFPVSEGKLELRIEIEKSADEVAFAGRMGAALLKTFQLKALPMSLDHLSSYDLTTFEGRAAWGYEVFHEWLAGLSPDAATALRLISGSEYRYILSFLRGLHKNLRPIMPIPELLKLIAALDADIELGKLPFPVKLYRASSDPSLIEAWTKLMNDSEAQVPPLVDSAYTFTSLDEDFVLAWNRHELRGKGVVMEIDARAGLRAGYVDRGIHARDYAEIILARGQKLVPVRAYTDASGVKRLVVTAE